MINWKKVEDDSWNAIMVQLIKKYKTKEYLWYICEQLYAEFKEWL